MPIPVEQLGAKVREAGLRVLAPLPRADLERLESAAGLRLPEDYREFLLRVADGGTEPCRLVPLERWGDSYWLDDPKPGMLSAPCLLTPELTAHGKDWLDALGVPDWQNRWNDGHWSPMQGTLAVAEIGCGIFFSLISTGPHRGRVFSWGDVAATPPDFCAESCFGDWLEGCLDLILTGQSVHFLDGGFKRVGR